jgi:hypothetical protein
MVGNNRFELIGPTDVGASCSRHTNRKQCFPVEDTQPVGATPDQSNRIHLAYPNFPTNLTPIQEVLLADLPYSGSF